MFVYADYLSDISSGPILLDPKQGAQLPQLPPRLEDGTPNCEIFSLRLSVFKEDGLRIGVLSTSDS